MIKWFSFITMFSVLCTSQIYAVDNVEIVPPNSHQVHAPKKDATDLQIEQQMQMNLQAKIRTKQKHQLDKKKKELRSNLHNLDVKLYKQIQKLAEQLYDPVLNQAKSRGGKLRLNKAVLYLSQTIAIHISEEYGTVQKIEKLYERQIVKPSATVHP